MKNYLITGGFGLIGSNLANTLQGKVTILTRSDKNKDRVTKNVNVLIKDLNAITKSDVEGVDVIYHCASTVDNFNVLTDPYLDFSTNVMGTITLLEACKDLHNKPKIIFLSTFFVYGNEYEKTKNPINEESKINPLALYPTSKAAAEFTIRFYALLYNIPYLICRLTNVYGEHESFENKKKGSLNFLIMQAVRGEAIKLYRDGNYLRDYVHVDDVVSALMLLEKKAKNEDFLIGYGGSATFSEILQFVLQETGNRSKTEKIPIPQFQKIVGVRNFEADTTKLRGLGWKPRIHYKTGLKRVIEYYRSLT